MKIGDLIRWNRDDYDESLNLLWFEKQGIVLEVGDSCRIPPVITVMWVAGEFEEIFADDLEVL